MVAARARGAQLSTKRPARRVEPFTIIPTIFTSLNAAVEHGTTAANLHVVFWSSAHNARHNPASLCGAAQKAFAPLTRAGVATRRYSRTSFPLFFYVGDASTAVTISPWQYQGVDIGCGTDKCCQRLATATALAMLSSYMHFNERVLVCVQERAGCFGYPQQMLCGALVGSWACVIALHAVIPCVSSAQFQRLSLSPESSCVRIARNDWQVV